MKFQTHLLKIIQSSNLQIINFQVAGIGTIYQKDEVPPLGLQFDAVAKLCELVKV